MVASQRWHRRRAVGLFSCVLFACVGSVAGGRSGDESPATDSGTVLPHLDAGRALFLERDGGALIYDGQPYVAVGVNAYGLGGCETGTPFSLPETNAFFESLRPHGLTRTWAFESQGIAGVEQLVASAEVHHQMVILSLGNALNDCGDQDGVPDGGHGKQASWYASGYRAHYLPWVRTVVTRLKDSPAVGMWELLNEPGAATTGTLTDATMRAFFDDVAATIKGIDPHHLVESGSQAEYNPGTSNFAFVHAGPDVDVGSLHEYDYDFGGSHTIVSPHFAATLAGMEALHKPLLLGEVGIKASDAACTTRAARATALEQKLDAYLGGGAAGVLVWNWSPTKKDTCDYATLYPLDPAMELLRTY